MIHEAKDVKMTMTGEDGVEHDITLLAKPETLDSGIEKIREMRDDILQFSATAGGIFSMSIKEVSDAILFFGGSFHKIATQQYRREVGKLPGSTRTKRLRKKRWDAVNRWFWNA